jgi:hypothetical protein
MNCQRFTDVVSELSRGQMMDADVRTDALVHSEGCEECAQRLTNEEALTRALRALSLQLQAKQAPDGLEFELRRAFRDRRVSPATVAIATLSRRYWLAVAAAILLVVGGFVVVRLRESQPSPEIQAVSGEKKNARPQESPSPGKVVDDSSSSESQRTVQTQPRRRHLASARRKSQNQTSDAVATNHAREIATEFIPLTYSSGVSLQDGGQIVRVELPRSALVKFGLPVNVERLNEKVKADVWLGVDGFAHAIRFVQ